MQLRVISGDVCIKGAVTMSSKCVPHCRLNLVFQRTSFSLISKYTRVQ